MKWKVLHRYEIFFFLYAIRYPLKHKKIENISPVHGMYVYMLNQFWGMNIYVSIYTEIFVVNSLNLVN